MSEAAGTPPAASIATARGAADIAAVRALFLDYAESLGFSLCFQGLDRELATLPGAYAPPPGELLLARIGGEIGGCVGLRPLADGRCEMKRLYLRPAFRGNGLGRRLATAAICAARAAGYGRMCLETIESMVAARALYASLGFVEIPAYCDDPLPGVVYCELDLTAGRDFGNGA